MKSNRKIILIKAGNDHERILICTGYSAFTFNRNAAGRKFLYNRYSLSGPGSMVLSLSNISKPSISCTVWQ